MKLGVSVKNIQKFDVVLVNFKNGVGSEQTGVRPAVVVQNSIGNRYSDCTIVLPITSKIKKTNMPTHAFLSKGDEKGLSKDSIVLAECVRQISEERIIEYMGSITDKKEQEDIRKCYYANFEE